MIIIEPTAPLIFFMRNLVGFFHLWSVLCIISKTNINNGTTSVTNFCSDISIVKRNAYI